MEEELDLEEEAKLVSCVDLVPAIFNAQQLWYVYLGLERLKLAEPLNKAVKELAEKILKYGRQEWGRV